MCLFLNDRAAGETLAVHEFVNSLKCRMFLSANRHAARI